MKTRNTVLAITRGSTFLLLGFAALSHSSARAGERIGVLVLAHGGDSTWNKTVRDAVEPLGNQYPVEIAFGMADPRTMQAALDSLESRGVTKIVVTQLFISSYSPIIRQNEFLLGLRQELPDAPMMMDHSSANHEDHQETEHHGEPKKLNRLQFHSEILLTKPLDDHPLVGEIVFEKITELSKSPESETVVIVAHGPNDEEDNKQWVRTMENIADQIRRTSPDKKRFKNIFCLTVRDDASKQLYELAKENLRSIVRQASQDGKVIVVPLLLSPGTVARQIADRLVGLSYEWNGKTLLPNAKISDFLQSSIEDALKHPK